MATINTTSTSLPDKQWAVQLVAPGQVILNSEKPIPEVTPHGILLEVLSVGLCMSDLKLLDQSPHGRLFRKHPRLDRLQIGKQIHDSTPIPDMISILD